MTPANRPIGPGTGDGQEATAPAGQRGFALLVALLVLLVLSILAAAGAFVVRSDARISSSHAATVRARELARSGISEYLASGAGMPGARVFLHGGDTAAVTITRLLYVDDGGSRGLHLITARGVRARTGRPNTERILGAVLLRDDSLPAGRALRPGTMHEPGWP